MKPLTILTAVLSLTILAAACVPDREPAVDADAGDAADGADADGADDAGGGPATPGAGDAPQAGDGDGGLGGDGAQGGGGDDGGADPGEGQDAPAPGPITLEDGAACVAGAECASGSCAHPCEGYGTCVPAQCANDADCAVQGAAGQAAATHCCVAGACAAVQGGACGDRTGEQGGSCSTGGQTACGEGLTCLSACTAGASCAASCETDEQCAALGQDLRCYLSVAGDRRCIADPEAGMLCDKDVDCGGGDAVCSVGVSWDGTGVIKRCLPVRGDRGAGRRCSEHMDCRVGLCFDGYCSGACTEDADCACDDDGPRCDRDQPCLEVMLYVTQERGARVQLCYPADRCESTDDCGGRRDVCRAWPETAAWATVCEEPPDDSWEEGDPCDDHNECESGLCFEGACADVCTEDEHCARGLECLHEDVDADPPVANRSVGICI